MVAVFLSRRASSGAHRPPEPAPADAMHAEDDVYALQKERLLQVDTGTLESDLAALLSRLFAFWRGTPAGAAFRSIIAEAQPDPHALPALKTFLAERRAWSVSVFHGHTETLQPFDGECLSAWIAKQSKPDMPYVGQVVARGIARSDLPAGADEPAVVELVFGFAWVRLLTGDIGTGTAETPADDIATRVRLLLRGAAAAA